MTVRGRGPRGGGTLPNRAIIGDMPRDADGDDAFAQTVAPAAAIGTGPTVATNPALDATLEPASPASDERTNPSRFPRRDPLESDETMAAPVAGDLPPLPLVPLAHYQTDREIARGGMGR